MFEDLTAVSGRLVTVFSTIVIRSAKAVVSTPKNENEYFYFKKQKIKKSKFNLAPAASNAVTRASKAVVSTAKNEMQGNLKK